MNPAEYLLSLEKFGIKFGLANIRALCDALGSPQNAYPSVLIAGTNGKGSVTAMVDRGLRTAGLRVGRYTSPHLMRLEERFVVDGEAVESTTMFEVVDHVRTTIDRLLTTGVLEASPTFFEATTAVAFEIFRRARVDLAVLEVGLGGRLDSTNIVEPIAGAITSIALEHEQYLGHTLGAIASEKAGIVRPGIPIVLGPLEPEAHSVILSICSSVGANVVEATSDISLRSRTEDGRTWIEIGTPRDSYGWIPLGLRGAHQIPNAIVALRLLEELRGHAQIDREAIVTGLRDVEWPGRLQWLEGANGRQVLLDAAHNPAGATALAVYLETMEPMPLVFGAVRDKNAGEMLKVLLPYASAVVITEPTNNRARPADELAALARSIDPTRSVEIERNPLDALGRAWAIAPRVCAAGSIFLIGDLLERLSPAVRNM